MLLSRIEHHSEVQIPQHSLLLVVVLSSYKETDVLVLIFDLLLTSVSLTIELGFMRRQSAHSGVLQVLRSILSVGLE